MVVESIEVNCIKKASNFLEAFVGPLGLEPRLFCTKNRRVASYTMGQFVSAKLETKFKFESNFSKKTSNYFKFILLNNVNY